MSTNKEGYFWPTPEQELLLKAALLKGKDAIAAWQGWAAAVDFDSLEAGSQRLLPLLYRNLMEHDVRHPALLVYKGFYRMTWYRNRLLCHRITNVLSLLEAKGISAVLLKGAALAPLYYKDWALRPMDDFDLLVPPGDAMKTVDLLCRSGWSPALSMPDESDLVTRHACTLIDDSGVEFDLHWRVMAESGCDDADNDLKNNTRVIDFEGIGAQVLSHTDQLFHVLVHGSRWNAVAPLRWVPDSIMILREAGSGIDWHRLLNEARRRRLVMSLKKTLVYLREVFSAPVPADIISSLGSIRPLLTERMEFWMNGRPRGLVRDMVYLWCMHARRSGVTGFIRLMFRFPSFLRRFWRVPDDKGLAGFLIRRLVKRISSDPGKVSGSGRASLPDGYSAIAGAKGMLLRFRNKLLPASGLMAQPVRNKDNESWRCFTIDGGRISPPYSCEINAVDHCNIACMDCNHASPGAGKAVASPSAVLNDLSLLSRHYKSYALKIVGGEPLLHPDLLSLLRAVRESNICEYISLVTNGTLLSQMADEIWAELDEVELSIYPGTRPMLETHLPSVQRSAARHQVKLVISPYEEFRITFSTIGTADAGLTRRIYRNCRLANLWGCQSVHEGYFFKCPKCIYVPRILDAPVRYDYREDGLKITDSPDFLRQLSEYLGSQEPLSACRYCLGSSGKHRPHRLVKASEWVHIQARPIEELVDYGKLTRD
jgi:hypothetical protein